MNNDYEWSKYGVEGASINIPKTKVVLKKGTIEYDTGEWMLSLVFAVFDSSNMSLDDFCNNYNIRFGDSVYKQLKELGY